MPATIAWGLTPDMIEHVTYGDSFSNWWMTKLSVPEGDNTMATLPLLSKILSFTHIRWITPPAYSNTVVYDR